MMRNNAFDESSLRNLSMHLKYVLTTFITSNHALQSLLDEHLKNAVRRNAGETVLIFVFEITF